MVFILFYGIGYLKRKVQIYSRHIMRIALKVLFLLIITVSCKNNSTKEETNNINEQHKILKGNSYKNTEANDLNEKGVDLSITGNYYEAQIAFKKSLKIEPDNPTTLSNLGLNNFMLYEYDNAIKYYQEAYKISDSTYHMAAINLGLTYYYKKDFNKGIEITTYVINNTTDTSILSTAYTHRALNFIGNNNCEKAKTDLEHIKSNYRGMQNVAYNIIDLNNKLNSCIELNP